MRILLLILLLTSCQLLEKRSVMSVVWDGDKAVGVDIPRQFLRGHDRKNVRIQLSSTGGSTAVLGEFFEDNYGLRFTAFVPLTLGSSYDVFAGDEKIGSVAVPESEEEAPVLLAIYPLQDTVPENLLKCYFQFSHPMREGRSSDYIHLLNSAGDTMKGTFLDLQPELWSEDEMMLTLWLDPGRIKLDLIPNKELGNPLKKGEAYSLHVSSVWQSKKGKRLFETAIKKFVVAGRDDASPTAGKWTIDVPAASGSPLGVDFEEPLDHQLILNTITISNSSDLVIPGTLETEYEDRRLLFTPSEPWEPGTYAIVIESRLEDLAGNNLNRLFETDLLKGKQKNEGKPYYMVKFTIK